MADYIIKVSKDGHLKIPDELMEQLHYDEGDQLIFRERQGVLEVRKMFTSLTEEAAFLNHTIVTNKKDEA